MTTTIARAEILKRDDRGRVRVPVERRELLLDEFEKSGTSGAKFARLAGIKYATFAGWVLKRRKQQAKSVKPPAQMEDAVVSGGAVRLFEALVEGAEDGVRSAVSGGGLLIELPGGSRMSVDSPAHLALAAELVILVAQRVRTRC